MHGKSYYYQLLTETHFYSQLYCLLQLQFYIIFVQPSFYISFLGHIAATVK